MAQFTPVGVQAMVQGYGTFRSQLQTMQQDIASMGQATTGMGQMATGASSQLAGLGTAAGTVTGGISTLGIAVAMAAVEIGKTLVSAIQDAVSWALDLGKSALEIAGRFQELTIVAQLLGQRMGASGEQVNEWIAAMKEAGIRTDVAAKAIAQFARYNLDMASAVDLARVAQDAAVLAGQDSSETLDRLIYAVTTLNPRVARTAGVFVQFGTEIQRVAKATGRATEEIGNAERVQIALNAMLKEGTRLTGTYEAAMGTAAKQLRTLEGRIIPELLAALGAPFQKALFDIVKGVSDLVVAITNMISEGGALYPLMINLGAAASLAADAFRWFIDQVIGGLRLIGLEVQPVSEMMAEGIPRGLAMAEQGFQDRATGVLKVIQDLLDDITDALVTYTSEAFRWGAEIVVAIAEGMIDAANTVLVAAINMIGNMLAFWFAPGSPPKVAPDLVKWAKETGTEWLRGFTLMDFSVLSDIQRTLKDVLTGPDFVAFSKELIGFISGAKIDMTLFDRLAAQVGDFGKEIATLTMGQIALARATDKVRAAEQALVKAQKVATAAQSKVSRLRREYNQMVMEGADPAALKAKLAEIHAAEKERDLAHENVKQAEAAKEQAEEQLGPLAEQVRLQELLVKQLLDLAKAQQKAAAGGHAGARGRMKRPEIEKAEPEFDEEAFGAGIGGRIVDAITKAVERAKKAIRDKLKEIFGPIIKRWEEEVQPKLDELGKNFETFAGQLRQIWDEIIYPKLVESWENDIMPIWEQAGEVVRVAGEIIGEGLRIIGQFWEEHKETIMQVVTFLWDSIRMVIGTALEFIKGIILIALDILSGDWGKAWSDMNMMVSNVMGWINETIGRYIDDFKTAIDTFLTDLQTVWETTWSDLQTALETFWENIKTAYETALEDFKTNIDTVLGDVKTIVDTFISNVLKPWQKAFSGVKSVIDAIVNALEDLKKMIPKVDIPSDWLPGSPSPFEMSLRGIADGLGAVSEGFASVVREGARLSAGRPSFAAAATVAAPPVAAAAAAYGGPLVQFGDVYIAGEMDAADFETRVEYAVRRALRRG